MGMIKTEDEIQKLKNVCKITTLILNQLIRDTKPGDTGIEINSRAIEAFNKTGLEPLFRGYRGFPAAICISRNSCVLHGIPDNIPFENGDVIKYDFGARLDGYCSDLARTFILGKSNTKEAEEIIRQTRSCLDKVIHLLHDGVTLKEVARIIENCAANHNYGNIVTYSGHGIGTELHEPPLISNCEKFVQQDIILKEGMVICVEPIFTLGSNTLVSDGRSHFNLKTYDGSIGVHFEDEILVKKFGCEVLTR